MANTTVIGHTKWSGGYIEQVLDLSDDSVRYVNSETREEIIRVDSSGYTTQGDKPLGKFCLGDKKWVFKIDEEVFMSGEEFGPYKLIEFELVVIPALMERK